MKSLGWTLTQYNLGPSKKRISAHRHVQRENDVRIQGDGHLHVKERGPGEINAIIPSSWTSVELCYGSPCK